MDTAAQPAWHRTPKSAGQRRPSLMEPFSAPYQSEDTIPVQARRKSVHYYFKRNKHIAGPVQVIYKNMV